MLNFIVDWRRERAAVRELSRLSDRQLGDLGIRRETIKHVVGAAMMSARTDAAPVAPTLRTSPSVDRMAPSWATHNRRSLAA